MYCIERNVSCETLYLTEEMSWSDDPKRAWRLSKKQAEFWLNDVNSRLTNSKNKIVDSRKVSLLARYNSLRDKLKAQEEHERDVWNGIGWGTGMRCSKIRISFSRSNCIRAQIEEVEKKLLTFEN